MNIMGFEGKQMEGNQRKARKKTLRDIRKHSSSSVGQ